MPKRRRCTRKDWERNQAGWVNLVPMKRHVGNGPARYPQHETSSNIVYFYNCKVFGLQSHHDLWCSQLKLMKRGVCTCTLSTPAGADGRNLVILANQLMLRYCFSITLMTYWSKNELDITVWKHYTGINILDETSNTRCRGATFVRPREGDGDDFKALKKNPKVTTLDIEGLLADQLHFQH